MYIGREKNIAQKSINELVQVTDSIINFHLEHPEYFAMRFLYLIFFYIKKKEKAVKNIAVYIYRILLKVYNFI